VVEDRGISEVSNLRTEKTVLCFGLKKGPRERRIVRAGLCNSEKTGSEESVIDDLYLDARVQLCRVVDVLVVVVLC
jgi:hypothetical protein